MKDDLTKPQCDCTTYCGSDPDLEKGTVEPCAEQRARIKHKELKEYIFSLSFFKLDDLALGQCPICTRNMLPTEKLLIINIDDWDGILSVLGHYDCAEEVYDKAMVKKTKCHAP